MIIKNDIKICLINIIYRIFDKNLNLLESNFQLEYLQKKRKKKIFLNTYYKKI